MRASLLLNVTVGSILLVPAVGNARCCNADSECPKGSHCIRYADTDAGQAGMCDYEFSVCNCDSDCEAGMRCLANAVETCPSDGGPCFKQGHCIALWRGPCRVDTDCGPGFACATQGGTVCMGSACEATRTCSPSPGYTACTSNVDCPTGWACFNAEFACKPFTTHALNPPPPPYYPNETRCYPPYYDLYDNSIILSASDPSEVYSSCNDAGAVTRSAKDAGSGAASSANGDAIAGGCACANAASRSGRWLSLVVVLGLLALTKRRQHAIPESKG